MALPLVSAFLSFSLQLCEDFGRFHVRQPTHFSDLMRETFRWSFSSD